jgi:hypothetical protein
MPRGRPQGSHSQQDQLQSQRQGEPKVYTAHEVARRYRVDVSTVRRWVKIGALSAIKLPHRGKYTELRFTAAHLKSFDPDFTD